MTKLLLIKFLLQSWGYTPAEYCDYVVPTLEINFVTEHDVVGEYMIYAGEPHIVFGSLEFNASTGMEVFDVYVHTYVNDDPDVMFSNYMLGGDNGVTFADHFRDCVLWDPMTGRAITRPTQPTVDGKIHFSDSFRIGAHNLRPWYQIVCDHKGTPSQGRYDAFAIDHVSPLSANAVANGQPVTVEPGRVNGTYNPSFARILTP